MSTHSIVGTKTATGYRGRYVHFDGHPDTMLPALVSILERDGFDLAVRTITEDHTEWTTLIGDTGLCTEPYRAEKYIAGYGNADAIAPDTRWYTENSNGPADWAYALTPTTIEVWEWLWEPRSWVRRPDLDVTHPTR